MNLEIDGYSIEVRAVKGRAPEYCRDAKAWWNRRACLDLSRGKAWGASIKSALQGLPAQLVERVQRRLTAKQRGQQPNAGYLVEVAWWRTGAAAVPKGRNGGLYAAERSKRAGEGGLVERRAA